MELMLLYPFVLGCDPSDHLQESPGPKSQKSLEKSLVGGLQKSPRKYPKKSKNTRKMSRFGCFFSGIFDFFGDFRGLFCRPPKRLSSRLFWDFGPRGAGDSCKWSLRSQVLGPSPSENLPLSRVQPITSSWV